jgi:glycosyltransferase involved in cell wall biosynthesis
MRVLQLHSAYRQPAGEDAVVRAEATLLREAGHEVSQVLARSPSATLPTLRLLAKSSWNMSSVRAVERAVRDEQPDVAHVHNTWFALSPSVFSPLCRAGVPVVMTLHNYRLGCISSDLFRDGGPCTDCLGRTPVSGVVHRCYRNSYLTSAVAATELSVHRRLGTWRRSVKRYIVPTNFAAALVTRAGVDPAMISVKPHFTFDPGPRSQACSASDEVLYVGRLAQGKGVEELLATWSRLPAGRLRLSLVGDGPLRETVERLAPPDVRILGWRDRDWVRRHMLSARALVFPSTWFEPFGVVLIEALAAGLPVVGCDVAAVRSIVQPPRPELLVPPDEPWRLTAVLERLSDDDLVDELGAASRARFEAAFTPERNLPLLEAVYRSVR